MTQTLLFDREQFPNETKAIGHTWIREGCHPGQLYRLMLDGDWTGFVVQHCGHPTAHWPYYVVSRDHELPAKAWQTLEQAKRACIQLSQDPEADIPSCTVAVPNPRRTA